MTGTAGLALKLELQELYDAYVTCLDDGDLEAWPEFFTEDCFYQVIPRENWDNGLPLATLRCESKAMLRDRVVSLRETSLYAPRATRHLVSALRITGTDNGVIRTQANYCVLETVEDEATQVFNAGRYLGAVVREGQELRFKEKHCVFDSAVVPTSLVYPI